MKRFITIFLLSTFCYSVQSTAIISGTIRNSKCKYVRLTYMGSSTISSPNYFGEKIYSRAIEENEFRFEIETASDYSTYTLDFDDDDESFLLLVRELDSIHISVDMDKVGNTFKATGHGSSTANYFFAESVIRPQTIPELKPEDIIPYWKAQQKSQISLIESFKSNRFDQSSQLSNEQNLIIKKLINGSILSNDIIRLLKNRTNGYIIRVYTSTPFDYLIENLDRYIQLYSEKDFSKDYLINCPITDYIVDILIHLTAFKEAVTKYNYSKPSELFKYVRENYINVAEKVLNGDILQKTVSDHLYNLMLKGQYEKYKTLYLENKRLITNEIFRKKLEEFHNGYISALSNSEYDLNIREKELNDSTIIALMSSLNGDIVYLTLWKVDASYTLTPFFELPNIRKLQLKYGQNVRFVNICIGDKNQKQHWASLIVNHKWKGEHYFFNDSEESKFREKYELIDALKGCVGERYYLLSTSGEITIDNGGSVILEIE